MGFNEVSYTSMQQIPETNIHFNVIYGKGKVRFQFSTGELKQLLDNFDVNNRLHQHALSKIIQLITVENAEFSYLGDAEAWLRSEYGLIDLQWQLRRVGNVEPVYEKIKLEVGIQVVQYPSIEGGYVRVAKKLHNTTASIIGFDNAEFITLPLELAMGKFAYTEM